MTASRGVLRRFRGEGTRDGAGVRLTRVIGGRALPELDPFLLFDEFGSDEAVDYIAGFPDHPHRGFETVTYMLAGRMRHRDSQGNNGLLVPGSVQWMTAGRGLVHSEMPEQENGLMRGFQLWVNLPARDKMTAPRYQDIAPDGIPELTGAGSRVRVLAGEQGGVTGAAQGGATEPLYLDVQLEGGAHYDAQLPASHRAFVYAYDGDAMVGDPSVRVQRGELAVLGEGEGVRLTAPAGAAARLVLVAGRPIGEPVARHGPFVMNTREEIMQAIADFRAGRF